MIKKLQNKNYGFTLLEVVLYLSILSTLVFGLASFVSLISTARVKNQTMTEVNQQALQIVQIISHAIHDAESINTPTIGNTQSSLGLTDSNNDPITFTTTDGVITIDRGLGSVSLNNDRVIVSNLEFKNLSRPGTPDVIQINFVLSYRNDFSNQIYNYSQTYVSSARLYK